MTTRQSLQFGRQALLSGHRAMLAWALMSAIALLSFFIHVINEQVQRGETMREQFRLASRLPASQKSGQVLRVADAKLSRQPGAAR